MQRGGRLAFADGELTPEQRQRPCRVAHGHVHLAQEGERPRHEQVIWAQQFLAQRQCAFKRYARFGITRQLHVHTAQVGQRKGDVDVLRAQLLFANGQRALQGCQRQRGFAVAHVGRAEAEPRARHPQVVGAMGADAQVHQALHQGHPLGVVLQEVVVVRQRAQRDEVFGRQFTVLGNRCFGSLHQPGLCSLGCFAGHLRRGQPGHEQAQGHPAHAPALAHRHAGEQGPPQRGGSTPHGRASPPARHRSPIRLLVSHGTCVPPVSCNTAARVRLNTVSMGRPGVRSCAARLRV